MACSSCAERRKKQQATSLQVAAQQHAERLAQEAAEQLSIRHAPVVVDEVPAPVVDVPDAPVKRRAPKD